LSSRLEEKEERPMEKHWKEMLEFSTDLARRAGEVCLGYFGTDLRVDRKQGDEPVTAADRQSQALIVSALKARFPEDSILAEEGQDNNSWSGRQRTWVVDPIDGTKDFIAGRQGFSVMIGLLQDSRPVMGVVHQPCTGATFQAVIGQGSFLLHQGQRTRLRVSKIANPWQVRLVMSPSLPQQRVERVSQALEVTEVSRAGSAGLKITLIARGERDLYVNPIGHCKLWDTCAPQVVLQEAGGKITDRRGKDIRYVPENLRLNHGVVASNGACHGHAIERLRALLGQAD